MKYRQYSGKCALVHYKGGVVGEEPVEDYSQGDPVEITIGTGQVPRGIDEVLYDMQVGEQRRVVIPCEKAYGLHDPEGVRRFPRSYFDQGGEIEVGSVFAWHHPVSDALVPALCIDATKDAVVIDYNHPLAGKDLEYWFELVGFEK